MDNTGQQLHPNWRALATVHIPLKRFIKEGIQDERNKTILTTQKKYHVSGVQGKEIKEYYEELVSKEGKECNKNIRNFQQNQQITKKEKTSEKTTFEARRYFRLAMENEVEQLKGMNFKGYDVNVCDNYGWSALMIASCEGAYEAVEFLLSLGVDKSIEDKAGKTAKDLACQKGYAQIVELLKKEKTKELENVDSENEDIEIHEPFYCEICKQNFREASQAQHLTSTIHQFNMKATLPVNKLQKFNIPTRNKGLQLMIKQGWDKESGLGPSQAGRLYPVKTVIRKQRTGLGIEQESARVTHFGPYDCKAVQRHNSDYYKKKPRNRNDIRREKVKEWKRNRRLRNELN